MCSMTIGVAAGVGGVENASRSLELGIAQSVGSSAFQRRYRRERRGTKGGISISLPLHLFDFFATFVEMLRLVDISAGIPAEQFQNPRLVGIELHRLPQAFHRLFLRGIVLAVRLQ